LGPRDFDKNFELFGKNTPIVLFVSIRFRNTYVNSKRKKQFINGIYPRVSSTITLPVNVFPDIDFGSEILLFNVGIMRRQVLMCDPIQCSFCSKELEVKNG